MNKRVTSSLWVGLGLAALAILIALAFLQYRWITRVSDAENERLRAHLLSDTQQLVDVIDANLSDAIRTAVMGETTPPLVKSVRTDDQERMEPPSFVVGPDSIVLTIPRRRGPPPETGGRQDRRGPPLAPPQPPGGRTIVELDAAYLKEKLLPQWISTAFREEDGAIVRIVTREEPHRAIYGESSDASLSPPDLTVPVFALRFGGPRSGGPRGGPHLHEPGKRPEPGPSFGQTRAQFEGACLLEVRHKVGSLDEVVAQTRRRNMAVSFVTLLLMAGAIGVVLATTRRAQELAHAQMEFVAGVSHELRTPLAVICSAADNLADGLVANEQGARRYGGLIRTEGRRLADMVEQILRFAGMQAGKTKTDLQPVDVRQAIDRAIAACDTPIRKSGCSVDKIIQADLPQVSADSTALTHALRNLIENAAIYGASGKWIGITAAAQGESVEIRVEDHGPGIEKKELKSIFRPFHRGKKALNDQIHGFGLGLALVKRIVAAHSGTVNVHSSGLGTCFTIRIPASR